MPMPSATASPSHMRWWRLCSRSHAPRSASQASLALMPESNATAHPSHTHPHINATVFWHYLLPLPHLLTCAGGSSVADHMNRHLSQYSPTLMPEPFATAPPSHTRWWLKCSCPHTIGTDAQMSPTAIPAHSPTTHSSHTRFRRKKKR